MAPGLGTHHKNIVIHGSDVTVKRNIVIWSLVNSAVCWNVWSIGHKHLAL